MPRSFRFEPPEPGPASLARPRLLHALLGRWHHRAVTLVGGPGLGKTTLVAQALAENRRAARGEDVWLGLEPGDGEGDVLARAVAAALSRLSPGSDDGVGTTSVADAVWRRSPTEVCLVFDDVHLLAEGSEGARWLAELIDALPVNGHVVLTSRTEPAVPLARLRSQALVLDLGEEDLRYSAEELTALAEQRGLDRGQLDETGGWPALAELASRLGRRRAGEYLWEEVLAPLGEERCRVLAVLCELGGADGDLAAAALDAPVDLAAAVEDVPLVAHDAGGWYVPHQLWRSAPGVGLPPDERAVVRERAVAHLTGRGRIDEAFALVKETGPWELALPVLRAACLASDRLTSTRLERWLAEIPGELHETMPVRLASALRLAFTSPPDAIEPLRRAAIECKHTGDVDAELIAITEIGKLAWWRQDPMTLDMRFILRVGQLAAEGNAAARALAALGTAMFQDIGGNDDGILASLASVGPGRFPDPAWEIHAVWLEGVTRIDLGDAETAARIVERHTPPLDRVSRSIHDVVRLMALWFQGRVDEVVEEMPSALAGGLAAGVTAHSYIGLGGASILCSLIGDVATARHCLDQVDPVVPPGSVDKPPPLVAVMRAALHLAEGDEDQAAAELRDAWQNHGVDQGVSRRVWRTTLSLSYVLLPEIRPHWDTAPLRGHHAVARHLARLLVAGRTGADPQAFATCELPDLGMMRATLHHRLAAELAVHLHAAGRPEGPALLDALGPVGRTAVRALTESHTRLGKPARALLATLPAPPPHVTCIAALGRLTLYRDTWDGDEVLDAGLRRKRVRELLAFLIGHRATTRGTIIGALWPDLDEGTANNNLAVTLSYLLRVLEPWRPAGEPSYLVRLEGQSVKLAAGEHLRIDLDDFDRHVQLAREAEADGTPSVALDHHLAAVALYRGELFSDLPETGWMALDREHYCTRFVATATRAGQLLLGRGQNDQAEIVARRAIDIDPWAEDAHGVLVAAALARGDQSGAKERLDHCFHRLTDLGVEPSESTRRLQRRLLGDDSSTSR